MAVAQQRPLFTESIILNWTCGNLFFSEGCACDVCDRPHLPSPRLGSHDYYCPTALAACSLITFVPTCSLPWREPAQLYQHHPAMPWRNRIGRRELDSFGSRQGQVAAVVDDTNTGCFSEEYGLPGCNAAQLGGNPTFRRNLSPRSIN
jgi:hypothetical protein